MKFAIQVALGLSLVCLNPAFAAATATGAQIAARSPAHIKAVEDLLSAMEVEKALRGVAGRSRYSSEAQRKAMFVKIDKTSPAEIYHRLAPPMAQVISADTAIEMTRFYQTPSGKKVIHKRYNSRAQIIMPGVKNDVVQDEAKEPQGAAYARASRELADAEPVLDRETFKLLQMIDREKR